MSLYQLLILICMCAARPNLLLLSAADANVPDNSFLSYIAGQYNDQAQEKYDGTKGKSIQYLKLKAGNHYAITDWNPETAPKQVNFCAYHTVMHMHCKPLTLSCICIVVCLAQSARHVEDTTVTSSFTMKDKTLHALCFCLAFELRKP